MYGILDYSGFCSICIYFVSGGWDSSQNVKFMYVSCTPYIQGLRVLVQHFCVPLFTMTRHMKSGVEFFTLGCQCLESLRFWSISSFWIRDA
jgi:hypothetical protein